MGSIPLAAHLLPLKILPPWPPFPTLTGVLTEDLEDVEMMYTRDVRGSSSSVTQSSSAGYRHAEWVSLALKEERDMVGKTRCRAADV